MLPALCSVARPGCDEAQGCAVWEQLPGRSLVNSSHECRRGLVRRAGSQGSQVSHLTSFRDCTRVRSLNCAHMSAGSSVIHLWASWGLTLGWVRRAHSSFAITGPLYALTDAVRDTPAHDLCFSSFQKDTLAAYSPRVLRHMSTGNK